MASTPLRVSRIVALAGLLTLTGCATLGTGEPLVSDRPDFTESTQLIAPGHVQVESGMTVSEESEVRAVSYGEVFTRIGVLPRLELRLVPNSYATVRVPGGATVSGREDPTLGIKIGVLAPAESPSWRPALSLIAGTTLPAGSREFRAPHAQPEAKLLASWSINETVSFASNLNYARPYDGTRSIDELSASASFGFVLTPRTGIYTEAFVFAPEGSGARKFFNTGMTYLLSPDLQLDARVGIGPSTRTGDYFAGVGIVRRW